MTFGTDIHGYHRMKPFVLAPRWGDFFVIFDSRFSTIPALPYCRLPESDVFSQSEMGHKQGSNPQGACVPHP